MEPEQIDVSPKLVTPHSLTKSKIIGIFIFSLIIIAGVASWTAILFYPKQTTKNLPVSVNEMENWKTYRNDEYGFEFKYPNDWKDFTAGMFTIYKEYIPVESREAHDFEGFCKISFNDGFTLEDAIKDIDPDFMFNKTISTSTFELNNRAGIKMILNYSSNIYGYYIPLEQGETLSINLNCGQDVKQNGDAVLNQILSTFKFNTPKFDYSKPFQKGEFDYFGVVTLTGYLSVRDLECQSAEDESVCGESMTYKYASFNFTNTDNELIKTYLNEISGNWYVREKSIGLGCYDQNKSSIESLNYDDNGSVKNIVTGQELETLLSSSESKQIKLQVTKSYLSLGGGAPNCYSLFREFKVVD